MTESASLIIAAVFVVAFLYSSVGHGGASGYLAVMALFAVQPAVTRPTALLLNLFVASIATVLFYRAGHFDWKIFTPFAVTSVPAAFIGGLVQLPTISYHLVLGFVLIAAAARLAWNFEAGKEPAAPSLVPAMLAGAAMGFVSGLVGVGGGIFLTPLLLLMNWTDTKKAAGVSALFILVNSAAGLAGSYGQLSGLPPVTFGFVGASVAGGIIGSSLGAKRFGSLSLRRILSIVLLIAAVKIILIR